MLHHSVSHRLGTYTCRATTNGVGTVTSAIARLQLAGKTLLRVYGQLSMLESHTSCSTLICVVHCTVTIFACVVRVRVKIIALNYLYALFSNYTNICAI